MGTNFYHRSDPCTHCGRGDEPLHIGKASAGWQFQFHGTGSIRTYRNWLDHLAAGGIIVDESGERITLAEFKAKVEAHRGEKGLADLEPDPDIPAHLDAEGNSFFDYDFG